MNSADSSSGDERNKKHRDKIKAEEARSKDPIILKDPATGKYYKYDRAEVALTFEDLAEDEDREREIEN